MHRVRSESDLWNDRIAQESVALWFLTIETEEKLNQLVFQSNI